MLAPDRFRQQAGIIGFGIGGSYLSQHTATRVGHAPGVTVGWASGAPNSFTDDVTLSRISAGVLGVNASAGSGSSGTVQCATIKQGSGVSFALQDALGVSHFGISNSSPFTNTFIQGNGSGTVFLGSTIRVGVSDTASGVILFGSTSGNTVLAPAAVASGTVSVAAGTYNMVGGTVSQTLTNKRINPRVVTLTSGTTFTPDGDNSEMTSMNMTGVAGTLTMANPTGTPVAGQRLTLRLKTTNAQTYSFGTAYAFSTSVTAPTTTAAGKTDYIGLVWNDLNSKWDVVAVDQGH